MSKVLEIPKIIIVRACVGCILPQGSILIGQGIYTVRLGENNNYYDYEISTETYDEFVILNQQVLMDNGLLRIEKSPEDIARAEEERKLAETNGGYGFPGGYRRKQYPQ